MSDYLPGYRKLAEQIILQARDDINAHTNYKSEYERKYVERNRRCAISFVRGQWFTELCQGIGFSPETVKTAAFK
jgi:hypothetical protein